MVHPHSHSKIVARRWMTVKVNIAGHTWKPEDKDEKQKYQTQFEWRTGFLSDADLVDGEWVCKVRWQLDHEIQSIYGDALVVDLPSMDTPIDDGEEFRCFHMVDKFVPNPLPVDHDDKDNDGDDDDAAAAAAADDDDSQHNAATTAHSEDADSLPAFFSVQAIDEQLAREEDLWSRPAHLRHPEQITDSNDVSAFSINQSCQSKYYILPNEATVLLYKFHWYLLEPHKDYTLYEELKDENVIVAPGTIVFHKRKHLYHQLKVLRVRLKLPGNDFSIEYKHPETNDILQADKIDLIAFPAYSFAHILFGYVLKYFLCLI